MSPPDSGIAALARRPIDEARVLLRLLRGQDSHGDQAARLERFYAPQADRYDAFRERLLHGRRELIESLAIGSGERLVELGCGTGRNLAFFGDRVDSLARVDLVDLCPSLLAVARRRWQGLPHVVCHEADATRWQPDAPVDAVLFSYSLSMIPDWRRAVANALAMLRSGGRLAVVDFTLGPQQAAMTRFFWRQWFAHDGVRLDAERPAALAEALANAVVDIRAAPVPYLFGLSAAYYRLVGQKPG